MSAINAVSTTDVQEFILDDVTQLEPGQIMHNSLRSYRADCQLGQFKVGASSLRGSRMEIEIIAAKMYRGEYYGYELQNWLSLLFIDPDGVFSEIKFKTESLANFEELYRQYRLRGLSLLGRKIRCSMAKRASRANNGNYYAVEFEISADQGVFAEAIAEFRALHYSPQLFHQLEAETTSAPALLPEKGVDGAEDLNASTSVSATVRAVPKKKTPATVSAATH